MISVVTNRPVHQTRYNENLKCHKVIANMDIGNSTDAHAILQIRFLNSKASICRLQANFATVYPKKYSLGVINI